MESNIDINIDSFESEECAICLEDIVSNSMTILNCGHVLHTDCLLLYANHRIRNTYTSIPCPVCRHPLLSEHEEDDQPQENPEDTFELESNDAVVYFRRRPITTNRGKTFLFFFICACFCTSLSIFMYIISFMLNNPISDSDLSSDK
jgi:hypothetical protein